MAASIASSQAAAVAAAVASPTKASGLNLRGRRRPDYDVDAGNVVPEEEA